MTILPADHPEYKYCVTISHTDVPWADAPKGPPKILKLHIVDLPDIHYQSNGDIIIHNCFNIYVQERRVRFFLPHGKYNYVSVDEIVSDAVGDDN